MGVHEKTVGEKERKERTVGPTVSVGRNSSRRNGPFGTDVPTLLAALSRHLLQRYAATRDVATA